MSLTSNLIRECLYLSGKQVSHHHTYPNHALLQAQHKVCHI